MSEMKDDDTLLLMLLADIRAAVGDPEGKLMQDELVERCAKLRRDSDRLHALVRKVRRLAARPTGGGGGLDPHSQGYQAAWTEVRKERQVHPPRIEDLNLCKTRHHHRSQPPPKPTNAEQPSGKGLDETICSESSSLDEVLAGNALFFLLDLRPLYDFVNASDAPRKVKDCLRRINLAAASIEGALGSEGYARAKARDEKMKADLAQFLSQNDQALPQAGRK